MATDKPNVIYINSHDTGRYIQPYGHAVPTPELQKFAEEGVLFRQNFCICPTCSPSRSALVTGSYPHENGMLGLAHRGFKLNDYGQHLQSTLQKSGYSTQLAGGQHVAAGTGPEVAEITGFDRYLGEDASAVAAEFLEGAPDGPFYLEVGFGQTHRGFPPIEECPDDPRYCRPPAPLPDTPDTRQDMARYKASARILDAKIGRILDALESGGLAESTLVIITTDHGIAFPRMKCNLQDSGVGTMLMMRLPGKIDGGKVVDGMTTHMDIYPTVCDLAGIERPAWLRGESVMPLVAGEAEEIHDAVFLEISFHAAYEPVRAVRTKRWKYIERFDEDWSKPVMCNCDEGESKSVWVENGWADREMASEELYDLCFDPNETCNLANVKEYAGVLKELRGKLGQWMKDTDDPLLDGPIDPPVGAKVNDVDSPKPGERIRVIGE